MVPFATYSERFNRPDFLSTAEVRAGASAGVFMLGLVALGAWLPASRDYAQLRPLAALVVIAVWPVFVVGGSTLNARPRWALTGRALLVVGSAWLHLFLTTFMVDSSTWPVRFICGFLLLVTMAVHGKGLRVTLDAPYHAIASTLLACISFSRADSPDVRVLLVLFHVVGLFVMVTLGRAQYAHDLHLERSMREKEALAAALLAQTHSAAARLERQLQDLMGVHHDARNLLQGALLGSASLKNTLGAAGAMDSAEVQSSFQKIESTLQLVGTVFRKGIQPADDPSYETFDAGTELRTHLEHFRQRHPATHVHSTADAIASLTLPGGSVTFRRILDNLLVNAAEGNGTHPARNIWLEVAPLADAFHVRISDDGPGFPVEFLFEQRQRYTSKPDGSGLGLVTVDALVRACGGVLKLANRPGGGAQVDVSLPIQQPSAAAEEDAA